MKKPQTSRSGENPRSLIHTKVKTDAIDERRWTDNQPP